MSEQAQTPQQAASDAIMQILGLAINTLVRIQNAPETPQDGAQTTNADEPIQPQAEAEETPQ